MSGLVDKWTSELAKLRNKGQAVFSSGSAPPIQEVAQVPSSESKWWPTGLAQALHAKKLPALQLSDGAVSMLVDSLSA